MKIEFLKTEFGVLQMELIFMLQGTLELLQWATWKVSKYEFFSGPYFPAFTLHTERYSVSFRIQSEWGKKWSRKKFVFGHFSRSDEELHDCYYNNKNQLTGTKKVA